MLGELPTVALTADPELLCRDELTLTVRAALFVGFLYQNLQQESVYVSDLFIGTTLNSDAPSPTK